MEFIIGFAVWLAIGLIGGIVSRVVYPATGIMPGLTIVFGVCGAFIGGMLGTSPYIHHDPLPLRLGGLIGATAGAFIFSWLHHFMARKAV
ncbi:MAG: GlsB/YeaQ/YmgE family stress response membrane protein [Longimicrobiales bacterium]